MKVRFLQAVLLASLALVSFAPADEPQLSDGVFPVALREFNAQDPAGHLRFGKDFQLKLLPPTQDGEHRYDVRSFLIANGIPESKGLSAIALERSGVVVVRASAKTMERIDALFQSLNFYWGIRMIEVTSRLWEYEDVAAADSAKKPSTVAQLRERGGNSLKLLDTLTVLTKPGNRVVARNQLAGENSEKPPTAEPREKLPEKEPEPKPADPQASPVDEAFTDGSRGSVLEIEPNFEPGFEQDRVKGHVDFSLGYRARLPQGKGEPDFDILFHIPVNITDQSELVVYATGVRQSQPAAKAHYRALTLCARVFDDQGRSMEDLAKQRVSDRKGEGAKNRELIRRAHEGLEPASK